MPAIGGIPLTPLTARAYFAVQALAGAAWWLGVLLSDAVRHTTLGDLPALPVAMLDVPLFVVASALVALGIRWCVWIVVPWTALVAVGMAVYATATTQAGWGALLMALAAVGSIAAGVIVWMGRAPVEWITTGPFAFRPASRTSRTRLVARTARQTLFFWGLFLLVFPLGIAFVEERWRLSIPFPVAAMIAGGLLLAAATALGVWSAVSMSMRGEGTPLPSAMPRRLVIAGPYRFVRNPMAVAGIAQGVAVGLLLGSWLVVAYALCGSLFWNAIVRPLEEQDLEDRFGEEFVRYRETVSCWIPLRRAASPAP